MMWKWKRPAAFLLAAAMIFTMPGVPAFAVETDVSAVSGNASAECICETHCEQEAVNPDCPVCAAEDADLSACKGTAEAACICEKLCGADAVNPDCTVCSAKGADLSACLGKEEAVLAVQADHTHCVCGGNGDVNGHEHGSDSIAWTATDSLPDSVGNYYLTQSVSGIWNVPTGEVNLCLNGQTISGSITVGSGATLTLTDCTGSGRVQGEVTVNGGKFELYSGTITGGVEVGRHSSPATGSAFTMYGGAITGNEAGSGSGGGVFLVGTTNHIDPPSFTMHGGTISNNTAGASDGGGGGVYVGEKCSFTMDGGTITGNTATNGGGIYIHFNAGLVSISNATITGNTASATGNTSYGHGGGIYSQRGVTVENVTITGNTSTFEGGGIYGKGAITLTDATVTGNNRYDVYYDGKESTTPELTVSGSVKAGYYANFAWKLPILVSGALREDSVIHVGVREGIPIPLAIAEPASDVTLRAENFKADAAENETSLGEDGKVYLSPCNHEMDDTGYTCKKCHTQFDVRIGESAYYKTLKEAFLSAWDNSTITLLRDVNLENFCHVSKTITLDLHGKTITSEDRLIQVDEKLTVKDSSEGGGRRALNVKFLVASNKALNGTLEVDDSYTGDISCVELWPGGALEAYTGTIQELLLGKEGKGTGYSVKLWKGNTSACTIGKITDSTTSKSLTVKDLLKTNHAKCELYGEKGGTWSIVNKSTKIVDLTDYTAYKVQFAECVHQCDNDTVENPVCSKCGKVLVVKITATDSDGKTKTAWFPADSGIENGDGYVEAIQTLNGWSAEGYTDATLMPLCDVHDNSGGIGIASVTLTGKLTVDGGEHLINSTTIAAGADVTFKTGRFNYITVNGKASFVGGNYLGLVTASSGAEAVFSGGAYQYLNVEDGGTAVVKNSAAFGEDVEVTKGTLTVEGGSFGAAVVVESDGTMNVNGGSFTGTGLNKVTYSGGAKGTISGGSFADLYLYGSGTAWLAGGSFTKLSTASFGVLSSLLADGAAYYDQKDSAISGSEVSELSNVTVKTHAHTVDQETGICSVCQKQMAASLTADNETSWYLTLDAAIAAANEADGEKTIKLYQDVATTAPSYELTRGPVTLDVNGKKALGMFTVKGIQLTVTGTGTIRDVTASGSSAVVKNSTVNINYITAESGGRLELGGGSYFGLTVQNDGSSASLSGGTYKKIEWGKSYVPANEYLADGYGYKTSEGTWEDGAASVNNVTVTPAPIKSTKVYPNGETDYSGSTFDAKDSTSVTLTVSVTSDESAGLTYTWYRSINDEWRSLTNSFITKDLTEKYTGADSQTLSITELPAGQTFSYKVQIVTGDGYKCFSKPFTVSTCAHDGDKTLQHDETHHWDVCGKCGAELDRAEHNGGTATCTAKAVCSTCQTAYGEPRGHTLTKHDAVDATCTAPGNVEYWHCSVCDKNFSDSEGKGELTEITSPALNHNWGAWEKVSETQHQRICQNDGSHKETGDHTPGTAATCKAPANCSICGQPYGEKNPSNHTGGTEVRNQKEATTTTEGYTGDTYCLGCGVKIASGTVIPKKTSGGGGSSSGGSGGGGGSSSGGSNGSGNNDNTNQPEDKPQAPVTGETKPIQPDANGNAAVDNSSVQSAIDKAKQDAKKNGIAENGIAVTVPITPAAGQTSFNVIIKAQTLDLLVKENVRQFTVAIDHLVSVNIGLDTLKQLDAASAGGDIILRADKVDALRSTEAKAAIGTRPAYDLSLVYTSGGKETPITNLNGHTVSVRLPYTPANGEAAGNLCAVYVDDAGKVEWITKSSYDASLKAVVFETGHFSVYGVGYKNSAPAFTDIHNHWAADNILFAASRGLLSGTSDTTFSPNTGMTRGMFVTALGRLAGINPDSYKTGKFTDVKADVYYAPYVNWAAQNGIVEGVTATTFAPDTNINREQMAVIMANYAKRLGYDLPKTLQAVTFADNAQIGSWAKNAVGAMQQAGILAGKANNRFDPKGTAARAEVATVLRRFVEIVIDPQAANG